MRERKLHIEKCLYTQHLKKIHAQQEEHTNAYSYTHTLSLTHVRTYRQRHTFRAYQIRDYSGTPLHHQLHGGLLDLFGVHKQLLEHGQTPHLGVYLDDRISRELQGLEAVAGADCVCVGMRVCTRVCVR